MATTARKILKNLMETASVDDWCNYIELMDKNFWTLQNNWMFQIEKNYDQQTALKFDGLCYGRAIEVAAYRLKNFFNLGDDELDVLAKVYQLTPAGSYIDIEFERINNNKLLRRVRSCPIQIARLRDGLNPIECKPALQVAATNIARVINPDIKINKILCPPDKMPDNVACLVIYEKTT